MYTLTPFARNFALFDALNDDFFGNSSSAASCRVDIREDGDKYVIDAELPGFSKEDIALDINGECLTIKAKHSESKEDKNSKGNYIRRERSLCSYERSFDISGINADEIKAAYKNGVLTLDLPKKSAVQPTARRLEISE